MKFKAKETSKNKITNEIWIIKDKVYDLKEDAYYDEEYIFKSESCDHHHVPKKDLHKWFETVEEVSKICEILRLEIGEKFKIKNHNNQIFKLTKNSDGEIFLISLVSNYDMPYLLINLIEHPEWVEKLPTWTDKEKEILKALKVLGFGWITKDEGGAIWAYSNKPIKANFTWNGENSTRIKIAEIYNILKSFVKWEDKEPFEIPNIQ